MGRNVNQLGSIILRALEARGWSLHELATETGLSTGALSRLTTNPEIEPKLSTLSAIADALDIELGQLIEAAGYPIKESANASDEDHRVQALVRSVPDLKPLLEHLSELSLDDRNAVLTLAEGLAKKRRKP